ncbi:hypothetical protein C4J81_02110 [Deltaproteobacteria bacterium Smac51]|nr:hypothetical protein C4J81_02110 [Deltaproteobacteria bacterium Smac51]
MSFYGLYEPLASAGGVVINIIHMLIYYRLKEGRRLLPIIGFILLFPPVFLMPSPFNTAFSSLLRPLIAVAFVFYVVAVFRYFIVEGSFNRIMFGALCVGAFNHLVIILIYAIMFQGLHLPADPSHNIMARLIFFIVCPVLFYLSFVHIRDPFMRILDAIEHEPWYIINITPLLLYIVGYLGMVLTYRYQEPIITLTSIMLALAMVCVYVALYNSLINRDMNIFLRDQLESSRNLASMREQYDDELSKKETAIRLLRHDFRHILGRLDALALVGDTGGIREFIHDITDISNEFEMGAYSENAVVNAIISFHFYAATRHGVKCTAKVMMDNRLDLSEAELTVLIGNALENCVKAASPLGEWGRISFAARPVKDRIVFKFENNYTEGNYKKGSGLGLQSIKTLAKQHGGTMDSTQTNGRFQMTVILPLSQQEKGMGPSAAGD